MTPPSTLKVGPYVYTVELTPDLEIADNLSGITDTDAAWIKLNPARPSSMLRGTLLHEVMHAVHVAVGIRNDDRVTPEQFVARCEALLLDTLRRNPALVAYLLAD